MNPIQTKLEQMEAQDGERRVTFPRFFGEGDNQIEHACRVGFDFRQSEVTNLRAALAIAVEALAITEQMHKCFAEFDDFATYCDEQTALSNDAVTKAQSAILKALEAK